MDNIAKIIIDYWFENFNEVIDTLEHWERKGENLFFENAIQCIKELHKNSLYQSKIIGDFRKEVDKQHQTIEQLGWQNRILSEKLHTANEMIKASKDYFKSDFRF